MTSILFICHGNICRSPMAEFIMKALVRSLGVEEYYHIESAAVSDEEWGNPIYPPARRCLSQHGIPFDASRTARKATKADYARFDRIVCMDSSNLRWLRRIIGDDPKGKVHLLMSYTGSGRDVADPWYTGDFETTFQDIMDGCRAMLDSMPVPFPGEEAVPLHGKPSGKADIAIRDATPEDAALVAWTVMVAIQMSWDDISRAEATARREDTLYSWKRSRIIEVGGQPAGCLISYPGSEYAPLRLRTWQSMWDGITEEVASLYESETFDGEYYLDSMGVKPEFRGMELGRKLLEDGVARARAEGYDRITLICESDHPSLLEYYRSIGFRDCGSMDFFGGEYTRMKYDNNK